MPGSDYSLLIGSGSYGTVEWTMSLPLGVMYGTSRIGILLGYYWAEDTGKVGLIDQISWDEMVVQALETPSGGEVFITPKNWICLY